MKTKINVSGQNLILGSINKNEKLYPIFDLVFPEHQNLEFTIDGFVL